MKGLSYKTRTLRNFLDSCDENQLSFDSLLFDFSHEFGKAFRVLTLRFILIDGKVCWHYSGNTKTRIEPEYRGFFHHLKNVQSRKIYSAAAFRTVPSIRRLADDSEDIIGMPCSLISGKRLWALIHISSGIPVGQTSISRLKGIFERLASKLSSADFSEAQALAQRYVLQEEAVASLVHELKSPLAVLAASLKKAENAPEEEKNILQECRRRITNTQAMITAYLKFMKIGTVKLSPVAVRDLIKEVESYYRYSLKGRHISLKTRFLPLKSRPFIFGHALLVFQVLQNLVDNAEKAIGQKGAIAIDIRSIEPKQQTGYGVEIQVSDSGRGIDPEFAERMFEPFVSNFMGGHGLGLSICRRIMELHAGIIQYQKPVKARPGGFTLKFRTPPKIER